jgi:chemotaxis protein methyltransferase CheR
VNNLILKKQDSIVLTWGEVDQILDEIFQRTPFDFRSYSSEMLQRRIVRRMKLDHYRDIPHLLADIRENSSSMNKLISDFCIHVTEMFRNPELFRFFRQGITPELSRLPFLRIWVAGCSTGEEAYSLAVLLQEEGILEQCRIYATDIRNSVLQEARRGKISQLKHELYAQNYCRSGGRTELINFGEIREGNLYLHPYLLDKITFSPHNLATDGSFHEFDVIFCRNVMIYFNQNLKNSVHGLLYRSLKPGGFLALGDKESVRFTEYASHYSRLEEKIYRKVF